MNLPYHKTKSSMAAIVLIVITIFIFAGAVIPARAQTFPVAFPAPTTFALHGIPGYAITAVAAGDFNGDGKLDVVGIANDQVIGLDIDVALGNGDGTFQTPITTNLSASNLGSAAVAVGDFNGDGLLDVAVWATPPTTTEVLLFLGNGAGSFTLGNTYTAAGAVYGTVP